MGRCLRRDATATYARERGDKRTGENRIERARGNAKELPSRARDFIKIHEPYATCASRRGGLCALHIHAHTHIHNAGRRKKGEAAEQYRGGRRQL